MTRSYRKAYFALRQRTDNSVLDPKFFSDRTMSAANASASAAPGFGRQDDKANAAVPKEEPRETAASNELKPAATETLMIDICRQDNNGRISFKVKPTTRFEKMFKSFCQRHGLHRESHRFLFDGVMIRDEQTVQELEMQDGDSIDCMVAQVGGV